MERLQVSLATCVCLTVRSTCGLLRTISRFIYLFTCHLLFIIFNYYYLFIIYRIQFEYLFGFSPTSYLLVLHDPSLNNKVGHYEANNLELERSVSYLEAPGLSLTRDSYPLAPGRSNCTCGI